MDIFLLKLVANWISVLALSLASVFGIGEYQEKQAGVENTSYTKAVSVVNEIIPYKTEYVYNPSKAMNTERQILVEGEEGLSYTYENGQTKILKEAIAQVIEIGTGRSAEYVGRLTTYGSDCVGCSKTGTVACHTKTGKNWSLTKDGMYYPDSEYGSVRIVAAALKAFPCGTIILVDNGVIAPFYAVVLDTGGTMRQAFSKGIIWMDLAFTYQDDAKGTKSGSKKTKFSIQRWGW
jgi:G5 domain.